MSRLLAIFVALIISSLPLMTGCGANLGANSTLSIVTSTVPDGTVSRPYSTQLVASGGIPPYTWQIASGALPAGLSLSPSGLVSGAPLSQADITVDVEVTDSTGPKAASSGDRSSGSNSKGIKFRTYQPLTIKTTSMPPATVGSAYNQTLQAKGGLAPYVWSITAGQLPPGLALNATTGAISGTPSGSGKFDFTAGVSDSASPVSSATEPLTLVSNSTPTQLTVITASLASATAGVSYTATLQAAGGVPPYNWSISNGSLPAGLALDAATGVISGTPLQSGTATASFTVKDSSAATASATLALSVAPAATLQITTTSLPSGQVSSSYYTVLAASGGATPYKWQVTSGSLPPGLTLDPNSGAIYGTPSSAGDFSIGLGVQDSMGASATATLSLKIAVLALQILTTTLPDALVDVPYDASLTATGGTPPYTWTVVSGSLPEPVTLASTTGVLSGTPTVSGTFTPTVQLTDSGQHTATQTFSLIVSASAFDDYGGLLSKPCTSTGYFHADKIGAQWWLCTPQGHVFWMQAVANITPDSHTTDLGTTYETIALAKYGNIDVTWGPAQIRRLKSWGFNSIGEFSVKWVLPTTTNEAWQGGTQPVKVPAIMQVQPALYSLYNPQKFAIPGTVKDVQNGVNIAYYGGYNASFPDLWDSNFSAWLDAQLQAGGDIAAALDSPWVIGWISDECDELPGLCGAGPDQPTNPAGYNQRHQSLMTLITSPVQVANPGRNRVPSPQLYADATVHSKSQLQSFLQGRYASISALNTAWGSNYTTFASTGTQITAENIGTGNGSATTLAKTLAHGNVSPYSVAVKVNGSLVGGDCPYWTGVGACGSAGSGNGSFTGPSSMNPYPSGGTITYSTGVMTITFASPPATGAVITVDYTYGGWGSGTGLLDEDGRHAWTSASDPVYLSGGTTAFKTDMNDFLTSLATEYFSVTYERIKHYAPHNLYIGPGVMGTWSAPASKYVLKAAAPYIELLATTLNPATLQTQLDYVATNFGDKPIYVVNGTMATPDSALWRYESEPSATVNTQEDRAQLFTNSIKAFLTTTSSGYGSRPVVGFRFWDYLDMWAEGNWGLVSLQDNAYDGVEACQSTSSDAWGYSRGGEEVLPSWQAAHTYTTPTQIPASGVKGSRIQAVASNGTRYEYECTVSGTSGTSAPVWPTVVGNTVVDGTVTWKNIGVKSSASCYGNFLGPVTTTNKQWQLP